MQKEWAWASQDPARGRDVLFAESKIETCSGRSREAHHLSQINEESCAKANFLSDAAVIESQAEVGNRRRSLASAKSALQKSQDRWVLSIAALAFARAGEIQRSQELVEKLHLLFPEDFSVQAFSLPTTQAAIKLAENSPAAAVELL